MYKLEKKEEKKEGKNMTIFISTMLNVNCNNTIAIQRVVKSFLYWVFSLPACALRIHSILCSILCFFSGLSDCERILQASSSLDRGSYFSC